MHADAMAARQQATPPPWLGRGRAALLRDVLGSPRLWRARGRQVGQVLLAYLRPAQLAARLDRLIALGFADARPTGSQLLVAGYHQMFLGAVEETRLFYQSQGIPWVFHNLRRFLSGPATLLDPVGLLSPPDAIILHLFQTFHRHPVYDLSLLCATPGGLEAFEAQLRQLLAGAHPEQRALDSLIEDGAYHARLPAELAAFRADPRQSGRPIPAGLVADPLLMLAMDQFKDLRGTARYAARLPAGPGAVLWAAGCLLWNQSLGLIPGLHLGARRVTVAACDPDLIARHLPA